MARPVIYEREAGEAAARHPQDPRSNPRHRERGPRRFPSGRRPGWTYELVARTARVTVGTVKRAAREGRVDMEDFESVSRWAVAMAAKMEERRQRRRARSAAATTRKRLTGR